jgi:hypothetical protein
LDLALGAARARLSPVGMQRTVGAWRDRTRASITWATVPALVALLLVVVIEQSSSRTSMWSGPHTPLSTGGRVAADAMQAVQFSSLAIVVLLASGWALVARLFDRARKGRERTRWLLLVSAPLLFGLVEVGLSSAQAGLVARNTHRLAVSVLSIAWDVVAVAGLLSVLLVVLAAHRADLRVSDLRGGVRLSQLSAIVVLIAALASVAWGLGVALQPPIPRADLIGHGPGIQPWSVITTSVS